MKTARRNIASSVRCPFCKCEERMMLYCEGVQEDTTVHLAFAYPSAAREYREKYCEADYEKCRIAQMLERKWEDEQANE